MPHLPCAVCSKTFYRCPAHLKRDGNPIATCSHKCAGSLKRGEGNPWYKGGDVVIKCEGCGVDFSVKRCGKKHAGRRFCSPKCRASARGKSYPDRPCFNCGKPVKTRNHLHRDQPRRFCSLACVGIIKRQELRGDGNGRFVDGKSEERYLAEFKALAPKIRERDGFCCQICNLSQEANGKNLDVHHVDYDKNRNVESNAVSLCRFCHGAMHGNGRSREFWTSAWRVYLIEKYGYAIG